MLSQVWTLLLLVIGVLAPAPPACQRFTINGVTTTNIYVPVTTFTTISTTASTVTKIITLFSTQTTTSTVTTFTASASTSYVFPPGYPPAPAKREILGRVGCNADNCLRALRATKVLPSAQSFCSSYTQIKSNPAPFPKFVPAECNASRVSSACLCLPPTTSTSTGCQLFPAATTTSTITVTSSTLVTSTAVKIFTARTALTTTVPTITTTIITTTLSALAVTTTVYPYPSNSTIFQGPTYGNVSSINHLIPHDYYYFKGNSDGFGANVQSCFYPCNFEFQSCIQATFVPGAGCRSPRVVDPTYGTHVGVTKSCPDGLYDGLTYVRGMTASLGYFENIIGPCGQSYSIF